MPRSVLTLIALTIIPAVVAAQGPLRSPVTIGVVDSVYSPTLKEQRKYLVYTPPSYSDTTYTPQRYPVLYLLDGDAHFHSVTGLIQILGTGVNGTYVLPEMIVVAIPNTDRTRDMTPTHVETGYDGKPSPFFKTSGGMANFFTFMKSELIPRIEEKYRTAPYRVLVGHSLGGITAINALYTIPDVFNGYVAIDPSLWWQDRVLLKKARDYVSTAKLPNKALYVALANTINPADTTVNPHFNAILQFNSILETYNTSGLRYGYKYYADDDHGSVPMIAEYDALRFIFQGYKGSLLASIDNPSYVRDHYAKISTMLGYQVLPPEGMVALLAQVAVSIDSTKALQLLRMNTELYPASARAFESLGSALVARRDSAAARVAYEKALALKPATPGLKAKVDALAKAKP